MKKCELTKEEVKQAIHACGSVAEAAEDLGISPSTIYRVLNGPNRSKAKKSKKVPSALTISFNLPQVEEGSAEIQVRSKEGSLLGTLIITEESLSYRRPNQKNGADRKIGWEALDKIMQLGIQ